jgi:hypothetical protein
MARITARYWKQSDEPVSCQQDLQALELKMRQINLAADQASLLCVRPAQLDEVEMTRRREILVVQREAEMIHWQQGATSRPPVSGLGLDSGPVEVEVGKKSRKEKEEEKSERTRKRMRKKARRGKGGKGRRRL